MAIFTYKAINDNGDVSRGNFESSDAETAHNDLSEQGFYIISLKEDNAPFSGVRGAFSSHGVKKTDVIQFASNIAVMLKAGVPILTGLEDVMKTTENNYFKIKIGEIRKQMSMGIGFSSALEPYKNIFPDILIRLIKIGEETGKLDSSMADVADHLQKVEDLMSAIKRALIYPAFILSTTFLALLFWLIFVLPKILTMFTEMGVELPLMTRILIEISALTQTYWYFIPLFPAVAFAIFQIVKKSEAGRYYIDSIKLRLPVAKIIIYNKLLALFCEQLRILISAGVTIDRGFGIVRDVIGNAVFQRAISKSKEAISQGVLVSEALKAHNIFPQLVIRMVGIGEASGSLDEQFAFLANHYMEKVDDISSKIEKMLEPLIIGVVGIIFAAMIVGLMLPIYDLISNVK